MSPCSRSLVIPLLLAISTPQPAQAQTTETCAITPQSPVFETAATGDRLHALPHPNAAPHTGFHGQGVYGSETLYFSHLAVFMGLPEAHPHNFQVILEVEFTDPESKARYQSDRAQHPGVIYTAVPPRFDLTSLVVEYPGRESLRRLPATTLFRGHFEQGGTPILEDGFEIKRTIHFREFEINGAKLGGQHYLLFGRDGDVFLSHLLSAPPDFDQILHLTFEPRDSPGDGIAGLVENLLAQGLYLHLPDRENNAATRLRAGDVLTCLLETGTRALPLTVELRVNEEAYCEEGEFVSLVTNEFNDPRPCEE